MTETLTYCERQIALWNVRAYSDEPKKKDAVRKNEKRRRAVEEALETVGDDIAGEKERSRLKKALMLNCTDRKNFPFYRLAIDFISERDFYRRRDRFLKGVLASME